MPAYTWYVNSSFGSDDTSDATDPDTPTATINAARVSASAYGADQTIEITDEGRYYEGGLLISYNGWTIRHTASTPSRPQILGTDVGDGASGHAFRFGNVTGGLFQGLEIGDYANYTIHNGSQGTPQLFMSGCFVHTVPQLTYQAIKGDSWATYKSASFESCVMYFKTAGADAIRVEGYTKFNNCLITATLPHDDVILNSFNDLTITASFCTFIARPTVTSDGLPIVRIGKIINSIVVATSSLTDYGIASDDHTYCAVYAGDQRFRNQANNSDGSPTAADISLDGIGDVGFQDSSAIGTSTAIAAKYILTYAGATTNRGIAYEDITTDISGSSRTVESTEWNTQPVSSYPNFSEALVINKYLQQPSQHKYAPSTSNATYNMGCFTGKINTTGDVYDGILTSDPGNLPFSFGAPGPPSIRRRIIPYVATQGSDPKTVAE
jgi:hypothetical protein